MHSPILFFNEGVRFTLRDKTLIRIWLQRVARRERVSLKNLIYVFCTDRYLLGLNKKSLAHDTLTDILTFDLRPVGKRTRRHPVDAGIYISIPRVRENARTYGVPFRDELHRVMVHGLLHLAGYRDKTGAQARRMRSREDDCLSLRSF